MKTSTCQCISIKHFQSQWEWSDIELSRRASWKNPHFSSFKEKTYQTKKKWVMFPENKLFLPDDFVWGKKHITSPSGNPAEMSDSDGALTVRWPWAGKHENPRHVSEAPWSSPGFGEDDGSLFFERRDSCIKKKKTCFTLEDLNGRKPKNHLFWKGGLEHVNFQGCSRNIVWAQRLRYNSREVLTKEVGIHSVIALATMFTKTCFGAMSFQQDSSDDISHFQICDQESNISTDADHTADMRDRLMSCLDI